LITPHFQALLGEKEKAMVTPRLAREMFDKIDFDALGIDWHEWVDKSAYLNVPRLSSFDVDKTLEHYNNRLKTIQSQFEPTYGVFRVKVEPDKKKVLERIDPVGVTEQSVSHTPNNEDAIDTPNDTLNKEGATEILDLAQLIMSSDRENVLWVIQVLDSIRHYGTKHAAILNNLGCAYAQLYELAAAQQTFLEAIRLPMERGSGYSEIA
jgi:hypothetical protein